MPPRPRTDTIRFLTLDELGRLLAAARGSARDLHALTPLFWTHVNPYGRFDLDMRTRIAALA